MKRVYVAPVVLVVFLFGVFAYYFLASPNRVNGGDVGSYPKGTLTLSISRQIYSFFGGSFNKGELVIFDYKSTSGVVYPWVGVIEAVAGESPGKLRTFNNEWFDGEIPQGSVAVSTNNHNDFLMIVPEEKIKEVVWYPRL